VKVSSERVILDTHNAHEHGHGIGDHLYVHKHSLIHDLPAQVKTVAAIAFIFMVVLTPVRAIGAFAIYLGLIFVVVKIADLPFPLVLRRMLIEVPFVLFAVLMPFFGSEPRIEFLGFSLSQAGLWAAFGILAKGTIGVATSITLAATTRARDLLQGLETIRVPELLVQIASFMLRYSAVVTDDLARMKVARESRGFSATGVKHWKVLANSAGALFIRSYERGERVHLAMLSRGYNGTIIDLYKPIATSRDWRIAMTLPILAASIMVGAWITL
jgi:cobalt/nickel transport system permease protein